MKLLYKWKYTEDVAYTLILFEDPWGRNFFHDHYKDAGKASDKMQHPFMKKMFNKSGLEGAQHNEGHR